MWLRAFILTQLLEVPVYAGGALRGRPLWQRLSIAFAASTITHPIVWAFTGQMAARYDLWAVIAVAEAFAVVVETGWLALWKVKRPWLWALLANAWSFGMGLLIHELVGLP
jgi:hypothetical protein